MKGTPSEQSLRDRGLIQLAVSQGDQKAYADLMRFYWNPVFEMMLNKTGDENSAEDLTIEAFGKAFLNLHKYSPDFAFSTWLFKIANNNFIDFLRRTKSRPFTSDGSFEYQDGYQKSLPGIPCEQPDPEENFIRKQKSRLMHEVVERLKPHYRKLIELRYFKEYSYLEIANELHMPLGTIKAQLFRARGLLYSILRHSREKL